MKLYFELFDYFSLFNHLLRTFVCDLCLIWWWGVTFKESTQCSDLKNLDGNFSANLPVARDHNYGAQLLIIIYA